MFSQAQALQVYEPEVFSAIFSFLLLLLLLPVFIIVTPILFIKIVAKILD